MTTKRKVEEACEGGRARLLAAAAQRFAARGYAATTVREILVAAGVTAPVLYHHFGNKEGLFLALIEEGRATLAAARARALAPGGSATERIHRLSRAHAAVRRQFVDLVRMVEGILHGPPEAAPACDLRALAEESVRVFEQIVREGVDAGELRPCNPNHVALALLGALEITARRHLLDPDEGRSDERLDGMIAVILAGVAPAAA